MDIIEKLLFAINLSNIHIFEQYEQCEQPYVNNIEYFMHFMYMQENKCFVILSISIFRILRFYYLKKKLPRTKDYVIFCALTNFSINSTSLK